MLRQKNIDQNKLRILVILIHTSFVYFIYCFKTYVITKLELINKFSFDVYRRFSCLMNLSSFFDVNKICQLNLMEKKNVTKLINESFF